MPKFVSARSTEAAPESPEALFRSLRPTEANVRHLWAHQADVLRSYHASAGRIPDVALELPTGAGKTLVGLLLAEFKRRAEGDRVAYICPTTHLANQIGAKARGYGIPAVVLTGTAANYDQSALLQYQRSQAVAITNYHTIFNASPKLDQAQVLVLDDAHAAEGPVASPWTIEIGRSANGAAYRAVLDTLADRLPEVFVQRLYDDSLDPYLRNVVELLGPHDLAGRVEELNEALETHLTGGPAYSARTVSDSLAYCLCYISWSQALIRPFIPPTVGHTAFTAARQRIYMSATPGSAGELERAFGVVHIERLPMPAGWEAHGTGRRLFLFPGARGDNSEADAFIAAAIHLAKRALVIAPSQTELDTFLEDNLPEHTVVLRASDIEKNPSVLDSKPRAVLGLANRYDGLDLPDESCRMIVLDGLPSGTHLQERFLYETIGAKRALDERIRARLTQGAGRCTRNANDFAAVIIRGATLLSYLAKQESVRPMHPELQAEIEFGFRNSESAGTDLLEMLESFLAQDQDWIDADGEIASDAIERASGPAVGAGPLGESAQFEVRCWQAAWRGDIDEAVPMAQRVADILEGDDLRAYRCFWLYLAASFAYCSTNPKVTAGAAKLATEARACSAHGRWVPKFADKATVPNATPVEDERAERAAHCLEQLLLRGSKFERRLAAIEGNLSQAAATPFEMGLQSLGELLGFESVRPPGQAQPDGAWREGELYWFLFEAKTEESATNPVSPSEMRQAASHEAWIQNQLGWAKAQSVLSCVVCDKSTVDNDAAAIAQSIYVVKPDKLRAIAREAFASYRAVRPIAPGLTDEEIASAFAKEFRERRLNSASLFLALSERPIARMRKASDKGQPGPVEPATDLDKPLRDS